MIFTHKRKIESLVYLGLWLLVVTMFLLDIVRTRSFTSKPLLDIEAVFIIARTIFPFLILFLINNYLFIPRLLFQNKYLSYFLSVAALIGCVWASQYHTFMAWLSENSTHLPPHRPGLRPLFPLPIFLDFIYDLLIVGGNLAIALIFQHYEDKLERESLTKANAENQLAYLKAQINPHFYMNMLNNIHGMVEINPTKAQDMLIDMSNLMRYMLYDSSQPYIALSAEIQFLRNYLNLMRQRYPETKVSITAEFPCDNETAGIKIPPLLYLVFIENAFKHGISYRQHSFVAIRLYVTDRTIEFNCLNSNNPNECNTSTDGIGLTNVGQRLRLIYGTDFNLDIESDNLNYSVNLIVPHSQATLNV